MSVKNEIDLQTFYNNIARSKSLLLTHQFIIEFSGSGLYSELSRDASDSKKITYWIQSASIPEQRIDDVKVPFMSQQFSIPKQIQFGEDWPVSVLLDENLTQYNILKNWTSIFSDLRKSGGGIKTIPSVQAKVSLVDSTFTKIKKTFILEGVWPSDLGNVEFQYENESNIQKCTCTLHINICMMQIVLIIQWIQIH
jgi:hypothetical protein